jgi:hypothetical protein
LGRFALFWVCAIGSLDVVEILLEYWSNVVNAILAYTSLV